MAWFYNPDTHNMEESADPLPPLNAGGGGGTGRSVDIPILPNQDGSYTGNASTFGLNPNGTLDTQDNGRGYFGYNTRDPNLKGVSLPHSVFRREIGDETDPNVQAAVKSGNYMVQVTGPNGQETLPIVDLGPAAWTGKAADLTYAATKSLGTNGNGPVNYKIVKGGQPTEAGTDNPQTAEIPPPPPAPPSWQDLISSDSWQNITPEQRQQATDKWYSIAFNYAQSLGGFSHEAKSQLYDFYQQQRTDVAKAAPVDVGAEVGKFGQQVLSSANESATKGEQGSYDIASRGAPPPTNSNSIQVQALENAKLKGYDRLPPDQQDQLFNQEVNALERQNAQDLTDYQNYNAQKAQGLQPRINEIEKSKPKGYENTLPGQVATAIGSAAPLVATAVASGPLAPLTTAAQMGSSGYEDARQEAMRQLKERYPDMQPYEMDARANEVAQMAFKANAGAGLAMGSVAAEVPIKNIVGKILAQTAFGSAVQGVAGAEAQAATNVGMAENVNPNQDIMQGVPQAGAANAIFGGTAHLAHAIPDAIREAKANAAAPETVQPNAIPETQPKPAEAPHPVTATDVTGPDTQAPPSTREAIQAQVQKDYPNLTQSEQDVIAHRIYFETPDIITKRVNPDDEERLPRGYSYEQDANGMTWLKSPDGEMVPGRQIPFNPDEKFQAHIEPSTLDEGLRTAPGETNPAETSNAPTQAPNAPINDSGAFTGHMPSNAEGNDAWVSAIANRYTDERSARGEIGEIAPGEGYSVTDLRNRGLRMGPEEVNQHVSDLMQGKGDPKLQAAAVTAEEARLSQRSSQLSRIAEDNPGDAGARMAAENAFNDLTDFHNGPVAKLKNNWHAQGMSLQGEVPVDLSTYNGLREAWLRDVGTAPPPEAEGALRRTARSVRTAVDNENGATSRLRQAIDRTETGRAPSAEQLRNLIMERMGEDPCII
jgi:hypothetical protein